MHYAEKKKAQRDYVNSVRSDFDQDPPPLYRADLFRKVKNMRYGSNVSALGVREIADSCRMSPTTVLAALKGEATKLDAIYKLSRYFGIPWILVFDVDKIFQVEFREDGTGVDIVGVIQIRGLK